MVNYHFYVYCFHDALVQQLGQHWFDPCHHTFFPVFIVFLLQLSGCLELLLFKFILLNLYRCAKYQNCLTFLENHCVRKSFGVLVYFVTFVLLWLISELSPFPRKSFCVRKSVGVLVYFVTFVLLWLISELSPFPRKSFCVRKSIGVLFYFAAFVLMWFITELSPFAPKLLSFWMSVEDCWVLYKNRLPFLQNYSLFGSQLEIVGFLSELSPFAPN